MRRRNADVAPLSDEELVAAAQTGASDAFGRLVERYQPAILRYLRRRMHGDACAAEDLAQDTFQHAFLHIGDIRDGTQVKAWLFTIAHRTWLMNERGRKRHPAVSLDWLEERDTRGRHLICESTEIQTYDDRQLLLEAFHALSPALQRAFMLHYIEGYANADVARIERITPSAAQSRAYRANREVRIRLDDLA